MKKWNRVTESLPKDLDFVWCCFRGKKVFLGYKFHGNIANKNWFNFETGEDCWVNWWKEIDRPIFTSEDR